MYCSVFEFALESCVGNKTLLALFSRAVRHAADTSTDGRIFFLAFRRNASFSYHLLRCPATLYAQAIATESSIEDMREQGNLLATNNRKVAMRNREGRFKVRG